MKRTDRSGCSESSLCRMNFHDVLKGSITLVTLQGFLPSQSFSCYLVISLYNLQCDCVDIRSLFVPDE